MIPPSLKYYHDLKDSLSPTELKAEFNTLLDLANQSRLAKQEVLEALWELANRQYHTYTPIDPNTKTRVAHWLVANWSSEYRFIQHIGMIAGVLSIKQTIPLLKQTLTLNTLPEETRKEIENTLKEIEPHIDDPYHDLR